MAAPFIPAEKAWVLSHYYDVPNDTAAFCEDLAGATVLNVGCGEMLTDFGLLNRNVTHITGLDLDEKPSAHLDAVAAKLRSYGIDPPADYPHRLTYRHYDGARFPFANGQFNFIFSWSAFEHVSNVGEVLGEIRRVLSDDGRAFIQVYPWYHCFAGSHLSDYIREPYFHLKRDAGWVQEELNKHKAAHPGEQDHFLNYMFSEYVLLNKYSADQFYREVGKAGFDVVKARVTSFDLDLSEAPPELDFSSLMICGTKMLLKKKVDFVIEPPPPPSPAVDELLRVIEDHEKQIAELRRSLSWRMTAPLRAAGSFVSRAFRKS